MTKPSTKLRGGALRRTILGCPCVRSIIGWHIQIADLNYQCRKQSAKWFIFAPASLEPIASGPTITACIRTIQQRHAQPTTPGLAGN